MKRIITILTLLILILGQESLKSDESNSPKNIVDSKVSTDQRIEEIVKDLLDFFPEGTKVNLKPSAMCVLCILYIGFIHMRHFLTAYRKWSAQGVIMMYAYVYR